MAVPSSYPLTTSVTWSLVELVRESFHDPLSIRLHDLDPNAGLLIIDKMIDVFEKKGYKMEYANLIFHFLHQHGIIFPIKNKITLVPSMIHPTPRVSLQGLACGVWIVQYHMQSLRILYIMC